MARDNSSISMDNTPVLAEITGRLRPDWNDPFARLYTLDGELLFSGREKLGIPYYYQRITGEDQVPVYFRGKDYVYQEPGQQESTWTKVKKWLIYTRFFPFYRIGPRQRHNPMLKAISFTGDDGHWHFACAEYDDLFIEAFDIMVIFYDILNELITISDGQELKQYLQARQSVWQEIHEAAILSDSIDEYLDPHLIGLIARLARDNPYYFT